MSVKMLTMAALTATFIAGCSAYSSAPPSNSQAGPPPSGFRAAAVQSLRSAFFDPYSVRDASISAPFYANAVFDGGLVPKRGWIVCVRANAKNRMGAYIGIQPSMLVFEGEQVALTLSGPDYWYQVENACKNAIYQPFPELEAAS